MRQDWRHMGFTPAIVCPFCGEPAVSVQIRYNGRAAQYCHVDLRGREKWCKVKLPKWVEAEAAEEGKEVVMMVEEKEKKAAGDGV